MAKGCASTVAMPNESKSNRVPVRIDNANNQSVPIAVLNQQRLQLQSIMNSSIFMPF